MRVPAKPPAFQAFAQELGKRAELLEHSSEVLRGNPLDDPTTRTVAVLRPASGRTEGLPLLVLLPGFTGAGRGEIRRSAPFEENLFQLFDRMMRTDECGEAVLLAPDCTTALGGSQYVNSPATGRYDDYVVEELLPWAEERFRTSSVGVLGQSSGGFGALHLALGHPGKFDAVGSSAGDLGFEYCFVRDLATACRAYQQAGGPEAFLAQLFQDPSTLGGPHSPAGAGLLVAAMGACYSPSVEEPGAFELPVDWRTGALQAEVWKRWKAFDPVARVATEEGAAALRRLKAIEITASAQDEWALDQGARWFVAEAGRQGLSVEHTELPGGHFDRNPRFRILFARLLDALRR
jgi:hypothetical protein